MFDELLALARKRGESDALMRALVTAIEELRSRAEAAESRLRELANAEPVGYCSESMGLISRRPLGDFIIPLIRRPEMPS